ncbi:MAG TPA: CRTAC1 family protein, partial [Urbifossiella sp.]
LYHNNRNGTFEDVTKAMGINGPSNGFACWAFDFDNDGWLDIFAFTTIHSLEDTLKGMLNQPFTSETSRVYRNLEGKWFQDVTAAAGLDKVYSPMGCNFGDIDNDGYLDFYLGTGDPCLSTLIPNRLFKNVAGQRFADISASTRTGHLQKGHGVSFGDWDRNGTLDLFVQLGGAIKGDQYHDVLFQNPGQGNNWLSVKLIGAKTNRAAIGARIKVVTAGDNPLTVQRHVSSGSSFGANPLEQHIGLGKADRVATLEVFWPASGTRQVFTDIAINQGVVITEFAQDYRKRTWKPIPLPE